MDPITTDESLDSEESKEVRRKRGVQGVSPSGVRSLSSNLPIMRPPEKGESSENKPFRKHLVGGNLPFIQIRRFS